MTAKDVLTNPLFQYSLELILPVVGYLFFGWTLPVIITFYFFDYLGGEIARHRRHAKVLENSKRENKSKFIIGVILGSLAFLVSLLALYFVLLNLNLNVKLDLNPMNEIILFLKDEGWILFPVVILANLMKDKVTFYLPKKYLIYDFTKLIKNFYTEISILTALIILGLFVYGELATKNINGLLLLAIFIGIKLAFDFVLVKSLDAKSKI